MATKKAKQVPAIAAVTEEPVVAKGSVQVTGTTATFYVNNVEVGHTPYDFSVTCARIPVKFSPLELAQMRSTGQVELEATVQIVIPVTLVPGLIRALSVQKESYEKQFGEIRDTSSPGKAPSEH